VNRLCAELASEHPAWAFVNVNIRTYYAEGSKTLAFEVAEQLGWEAPDHVVVPVASGQPAHQDRKRASKSSTRSGSSIPSPT
jgi:threonine synthase